MCASAQHTRRHERRDVQAGLGVSPHLRELGKRSGKGGFSVEVLASLDYREGTDDPAGYKDELEQLRDLCLERDENATLLWR